jgi:hypothetical protein
MILLLVIPSWLLILSLVLALCLAARRGEVDREQAPAPQACAAPVEHAFAAAEGPGRRAGHADPSHQLLGAGGTAA